MLCQFSLFLISKKPIQFDSELISVAHDDDSCPRKSLRRSVNLRSTRVSGAVNT